MKKRILAILGLLAYIAFIICFTVKDLPPLGEKIEIPAEKNSVEVSENIVSE